MIFELKEHIYPVSDLSETASQNKSQFFLLN
jgi:hypothetical protein